MTAALRTRFAPSPTGLLHLGTAFSALYTFEKTLPAGGAFLLRMDDLDQGRCRTEYEQAILEDLAWLGIGWLQPVVRQSERQDHYRGSLEILATLGVTYPCFCTRKEIAEEAARSLHAPHGPEGILYPGTCRGLSNTEVMDRIAAGKPSVTRLNLTRAFDLLGGDLFFEEVGAGPDGETGTMRCAPELLGDIVLARKDFPGSYHLCTVVDDASFGINYVARGEDLFHATSVHRLLQELLGLPAPIYDHHKLIKAADGRRLSKRDADLSIQALRDAGSTPADVRARLGFLW